MRRTKIIATIGPATDSKEMIEKLIIAGMNIARLNMSHADHDWLRRVVKDIRETSKKLDKIVGIMLDTQGPAIRTGDLKSPLNLKPGEKFVLTVRGERCEEVHSVDVNYDNFVNDINVGDIVLIDNGTIQMKVLAKHKNKIECLVLTPGKLESRRHINLPGVKVSLPALTAKDLADIAVGLELGIDFIALSFVREAKDVQQLRAVIERAPVKPLVISKIEDQQAVKNIEEIISESDGVMIARGDLGIECPFEELPIIQRNIISFCMKLERSVIVATHMLESMIEKPMPTRAEITDVANAVFEQADAIMLSGETSVGKYPIKCIEICDRIATKIEQEGESNLVFDHQFSSPRQKLVQSAVVMANQLKAETLVVFTIRGNMARHASWLRPKNSPIYAVCEDETVARALTLNWGVIPIIVPFDHEVPEKTIDRALDILLEKGLLHKGNMAVVTSSLTSCDSIVDGIQMRMLA